jgi:hypothetical protein
MFNLMLLCIRSRKSLTDTRMSSIGENAALDQLKLLIIRRICIASTRLEMVTDLKNFLAAFEEVDKKTEKDQKDAKKRSKIIIHPETKASLYRAGDDEELMEKIKSAKVVCIQIPDGHEDDGLCYVITKDGKATHWSTTYAFQELGFDGAYVNGLDAFGIDMDKAGPGWCYGYMSKKFPPAKEDVQSAMKGL